MAGVSLNLESDFPQLNGRCYLDHAGATLPSACQLEKHISLLQTDLMLNPHSTSTDDDGAGDGVDYIEEARRIILSFFNTSPDEYSVIFTSGATEAIRKVGEHFDYGDNGLLCYLNDNHTSVLGIREYALARGTKVRSVSEEELLDVSTVGDKGYTFFTKPSCGLFVFPAQSNFSGRKYNLDWVHQLKRGGTLLLTHCTDWFVLVDAASLVATSPLDLSGSLIDFVPVSFYKIFGYPTGIGALLVKNSSLHKLKKAYFGGGTVEAAGVDKYFHFPLQKRNMWFEDGTLPFQQIAALRFGFDEIHLRGGMASISSHTFELAKLTHDTFQTLCHPNGAPLVRLYCDTRFTDSRLQGPIICFNLMRSNGDYIGYHEVQLMANLYSIVFRTGCFCNIGACQKFLEISTDQLERNHKLGHKCGSSVDIIDRRPTGAIRVSFGYMTTLKDVETLVNFVKESFCERSCAPDIPRAVKGPRTITDIRLAEINIFPIKSCGVYKVTEWALSESGLLYDRTWSIIDSANTCLTMKRCVDMRKIKPEIDMEKEMLTLTAEGFPDISIPLEEPTNMLPRVSSPIDLCSVKVCGKLVETVDCGKDVSAWISDVLVKPGCRLVRRKQSLRCKGVCGETLSEHSKEETGTQTSLANDSQYLLLSTESVSALCTYITEEMNCFVDEQDITDRFRANLIVSGAEANDEVTWSSLEIDNKYRFKCIGECERCSMISIEQETGDKMKEPLRSLTLMKGAKPSFGVHLSNADFNPGGIKVGDLVKVMYS